MDAKNALMNKTDMYPTCGAHILTGKTEFNKYDRAEYFRIREYLSEEVPLRSNIFRYKKSSWDF